VFVGIPSREADHIPAFMMRLELSDLLENMSAAYVIACEEVVWVLASPEESF
jgi:hypothetical protein